MKTTHQLYVRAFPIRVRDNRTGEEKEDRIVLTKEQLQAAQVVGQSSKELIQRICGRQGYTVLDVGRADRQVIALHLDGLYLEATGEWN